MIILFSGDPLLEDQLPRPNDVIGFENGSSETRRLVDGAISISRADNIENMCSDIGD